MDLATGHALQLGIAVIFGLIFFAASYALSERVMLGILIVLIPFQLITSRYGTMNMVLVYLVAAAFILKGRLKFFPLLGSTAFIILVYVISISLTLPATYQDHVFYLITIGSNFVLFYLVYNYFRQSKDLRYAFNLVLIMNFLVVCYGLIQLTVGFNQFSFFGIGELAFSANLEEKQRLIGAFSGAGVNGEYFAILILFIGYMASFETRIRIKIVLLALMALNFGLLVATGSRGSFLSLVGGGLIFLWAFRKQLGVVAVAKIVVVASVLFTCAALIIVNYTNFNVLFDRLSDTEIGDSGVPDTREKAFELTIERIPEALLVGHGPRMVLIDEYVRRIKGYQPLGGYPHNLYLFLLYTLGMLGLLAYLILFLRLMLWWKRAARCSVEDSMLSGVPKLALVLMVVFLVDQLKIEFLRAQFADMQHVMFTLWAIFLAFSAVLVEQSSKTKGAGIKRPVLSN